MKRILCSLGIIGGLLLTTKQLSAQGTVVFANNSANLVITNNNYFGSPTGPAKTTASGGNIHVALYWGVLGSSEAQLVQIGSSAGISPLAGRINAGNYTTGSATAPGAMATFQVRGWTGNYATYEAAYAAALGGDTPAQYGVSQLFNSSTGGAGTPAGAPATLSLTMPGFLIGVPEPSTYAFFGLGMVALISKRFWRK